MKDINNYIVEKLSINNNTKLAKSHESFDTFQDYIKYIKEHCSEYNLVFEKEGYWVHLYYKKLHQYPALQIAYSKDEQYINTVEHDGKYSSKLGAGKETVIIVNKEYSSNDFDYIHVEGLDGVRDKYKDFLPSEYNVDLLMKTLEKYSIKGGF